MSAHRPKRLRVKTPGHDAAGSSHADGSEARSAFSLPQANMPRSSKTSPPKLRTLTGARSHAVRSAPSTPAPVETPTAMDDDGLSALSALSEAEPMDVDAADAAPASPMSPSLVSVRSPTVPATPVVLAPPAIPLRADSAAARLVALFESITSESERKEALRRLIQQCPAHDFVFISSLIQPFLRVR